MASKLDTSKLAYTQTSVDEILQCSLCLDRFTEPRALPCQHVFCTHCLQSISIGMKSRRTLTCPLCRRVCPFKNQIQSFPISYVHQQLLDLKPINYDVTSRCAKCYLKQILHPCPCCEYLLCTSCIDNDRQIFINHCFEYHRISSNLFEQIEEYSLLCYPLPIDPNTINAIQIDLTQIQNDLQRKETLTFDQILTIWKNLVKIKEQLDQQNRLPVTVYKRPLDEEDEIISSKRIEIKDEPEEDEEDLIYLETIPPPANIKDQSLTNASGTKEKRPFLRRRQGLAHYQAPPKRRQRPPVETNSSNKTEPVKRPNSANNNSRTNPRPRSLSSSSSSTKPSTTNTTAAPPSTRSVTKPTKPPTVQPTTNGNLLGQVDLDDDDDLLSKYSTKKDPPSKLSSQLQSLIDLKWNSKDKVSEINDNDEEIVEEEEEEEHVFSTVTTTHRQRTSSRSNQPKQDLDEFEKLEQYAEEHPSMISTASYVEQVVFKDHHVHRKVKENEQVFFKGHFHQEPVDEEDETVQSEELSNHSHRIRQRKIKPLKSKPSPPPSDDEDEEEEDQWNDVGVAKVIPVNADEYNSDSGISSLRTDFTKKQHQRGDPSEFGDEQSWMDRVTLPGHNSLMLKTFPGLRQTTNTVSIAPPPPPPPPAPVLPSVHESNSDLSRLMREKSKELEKQIEIFQKENAKLESLCNERNLAIKKLKQDRDEFERTKQREIDEFEKLKEDEMKKLRQEKRLFEQHRQQLREHPDKREREEIETLKKQVIALQEDLKQRESRWSATVNRLKERLETLEYENAELKQEKEIIERKRLDLMHQLQTTSTKTLPDDPPVSSRKSLVEQVTKRPKSTVPTTTATSKTQSLPKTMVVRISEPTTLKSKVSGATTGRRTPTNVVGVNGIKNNVDTSRKLTSLPTTTGQTKRSVSLNEFVGSTERVDSGNGESDEEVHRMVRTESFVSPSFNTLVNTDYPKEENIDYKSLLTMANRTTSSATTLLQQHQASMSKQSPHSESILPIPRATIPTAKTLTNHSNEQSSNEEIRHQDGRIERVKSDGSRTIHFPNGSKQEISADGQHIRVYFYNGDFKEKMPDGRCIYKYVSTNTIETEYPDGTRICEFPNGQIEKHFPDGRQEHTLPDRTKNIYLPDGTIITLKTNGEKFIQHTNQTKEIHTETFKRKLFPNGSILTVFNTGEQEVRYANGKIKLKDAQGNVIMEKKSAINH